MVATRPGDDPTPRAGEGGPRRTTAQLAADPAFTGTYAPIIKGRPGNNVVFLGDSITRRSDTPGAPYTANIQHGTAWPVYASLISGQRINYKFNAGIPGNNTTQMLARFDTDVTPFAPAVVAILAGTNDLIQSVALATTQANIRALVAKTTAIGAIPVLCTVPPNSAGIPANIKTLVTQYNAWLRRYAVTLAIPVIDFYALLVDPANGSYLAAYNNDGTHPNNAGDAAMGTLAASVLAPLLPAWGPPLVTDANDPNNLVAGGLFLANAAGLGTGWSQIAATSGVALSITAGDATMSGNWETITATSSVGTQSVYQSLATTPIAGHVYAYMGRVKAPSISAGSFTTFLRIQGSSPLDVNPVYQLNQPITNGGVFYAEATAPAGCTGMQVFMQTAAGTSAVQWAQLGVYDLTALGIVTP